MLLTGVVGACGGSASETPPPVPPDSHEMVLHRSEEAESGTPQSTQGEPAPVGSDAAAAAPDSSAAAPATWGTGRRAPTAPGDG